MDISEFMKENRENIWNWQLQMNLLGARYTGTNSQNQYISFLKKHLEAAGLSVFSDQYRFHRREILKAELYVKSNKSEEKISISSYYPYSGITGEAGICGEMVYCKNNRQLKKAAGKIAVMEINNILFPTRLLFKIRKRTCRLPHFMRHSVVGGTVLSPNLTVAEKYGVLGMICIWKHSSDEMVSGQYLPFTTPPQNCPTVWVGRDTGNRLKKLAQHHQQARLVLAGKDTKDAVSETVYAILPGRDHSESILINTHTDGPNACEENGGIALLALADYFSKVPQQRREKTLIFVLATGHFQIPQFGIEGRQATSRWLKNHENLWAGKSGGKRAVAGITIEHLGCLEYCDRLKQNQLITTNRPDYEFVYTSDKRMDKILWDAATCRTKIRLLSLKPGKMYFGEGQPLYQVSIPTISFVPAPLYLCSEAPNGHIEKIDQELMMQQIGMFAHIIEAADKL